MIHSPLEIVIVIIFLFPIHTISSCAGFGIHQSSSLLDCGSSLLSSSSLSSLSTYSQSHIMNKIFNSRHLFRRTFPQHLFLTSQSQNISFATNRIKTTSDYKKFSYSLLSTTSSTSSQNKYIPPDPKRLASLMPEKDVETGQLYTTYEKCVRRLYLTNLFHPVKLGLQNMEQLHKALGSPMDQTDKVTVIHVAGTNGKGSVAFKIAKTFELAGYNVGLFVSPHIASFRERMQINSEPISEKEVEDLLPKIYDICEQQEIPATFFEVTTALAFAFFQQRNAEVVVLETGLGGRLDATNVISYPKLSVITSIGLEHTRILGDTIELIAKEKAGIMKANAPVLVGPDVPHDVMRECAAEKHAEGYYTCNDILGESINKSEHVIHNNIEYVDYDIQNSLIAKAAMKILEQQNNCTNIKFPIDPNIVERGIITRPPCRFEKRVIDVDESSNPVTVILDVAHNPPAMEHLVLKLNATYPDMTKRIVVGFSADKDLSQCSDSLLKMVDNPSQIHLVEAAHPRAAKLEDIVDANPKMKETNFDEEDRSITAQVKSALSIAGTNNEMLIVCGSVFLMAEAREAMGIEEPKDSKYIAEVAGANLRHGQEFFANADPEKDEKGND